MSNHTHQEANVEDFKALSAIWLIPTIALIFGVWLIIKAVSERGTFITVQFDNASGIIVGKTEVRYKGLPAGVVRNINISDDLQSVIVEIEMASSTNSLLTENTLFWYVTADVSLQGVTGLDTIFSGSYINIQPDFDGNGISQRQFIALSEAPPLNDTTPGLHLILQADTLGSIGKNSPVSFKKLTVGHVSGYRYNPKLQKVDINVFIRPEYAYLVKENSRFWNGSGFEISGSLTSDIHIKTESMASIITGGIAFDDAKFEPLLPKAKNGQQYQLHPNFQAAEMGKEIELILDWDAGIDRGASILYQGLKLGVISSFSHIDTENKKIVAKAKVNPRISPYLTSETQFYVVKPQLDLAGVTNINAVFKGSHISFRPTLEGESKTSFIVFNSEPAYSYNEPGLHLVLKTKNIDSLRVGSGVFYKKQKIGSIQAIQHQLSDQHQVHIHIEEAFQNYVKSDSHFWNVSGLKVSGNLQGLELKAHSLQSMLTGGIAFDVPDHNNKKIVKNGDSFTLFEDQTTAEQRSTFILNALSAKGLSTNTRILFRGEKIGSIHRIQRQGERIILHAGILPNFDFLLKAQSQFWLVKPTMSLAGLKDTDALFGGSYIGVNAGEGETSRTFNLTETSPKKHLSASGLQLTLTTEQGNIVTSGSPVSYKGMIIGQVDNVSLSSEGKSATLNITIDEPYRNLVTHYSRFYNASGVSMSGGLTNFLVKTESVNTILTGGISFYNPENNENKSASITEGTSFTLFEHYQDAKLAGIAIKIHFNNARGLKAKLAIKYQDQVIGRITRVVLNDDEIGATVYALLNDNGKKFADEGTKFWHAKTELGLVGSANLSAILDGGFIEALPSNSKTSRSKTNFIAEDIVPAISSLPYGLNLTLIANRLGSVRVGNPVLYRQVKVGEVIGVELSTMADSVNVYVNITQRYASLVTEHSKFWNTSGFTIDAGILSGIKVDSESIETLLAGGIAFATPDSSNKHAEPKKFPSLNFKLHARMDEKWAKWSPQIALD